MQILINGGDACLGTDTWLDFLPYKDITNLARAGARSDHVMASTRQALENGKHDLIIVMWPVIPGLTVSLLEHMIELQTEIKRHGTNYVYTWDQDCKLEFTQHPELYDQIDQAHVMDGVILGDVARRNGWYAPDQVTPSRRAHQFWASNFATFLGLMLQEQTQVDQK